MRRDEYDAPDPEFTGKLDVMRDDADSSYNALQFQCRRRFSHKLQALLPYACATLHGDWPTVMSDQGPYTGADCVRTAASH